LPCLNEDTSEGTESDLVFGKLEAISVRTFAKGFLFLQVRADFVELGFDVRACRWLSGEARERISSIGITSAFDQPTRGLLDPQDQDC
jgi:hypothetical protein